MKYKILRSFDEFADLVDLVNESIAAGWKPLGGICVSTWISDEKEVRTEYVQAMIFQHERVLDTSR